MSTLRVARRRRYTQVDRRSVNDAQLSFRARGLLVWLLDKPDDWAVDSTSISEHASEGRDAIRTALRELELGGYLVRSKRQGDLGRWLTETLVYEHPDLRPDAWESVPGPTPGNPTPGEPTVGGPVAKGPKTETENSSSSHEAEAEARQSAERDGHGFELLQLVAERIDDDRCRRLLWRPEDRGARVLLGRRLAHLEDLGWDPAVLAVELAGGLQRPEQITSSAAVLLTRARTLRAVVATDLGPSPDPAADRQRALIAAHRYGENLALVDDLDWDELVAECEHAYPDDAERIVDAVNAARRVRAFIEQAG